MDECLSALDPHAVKSMTPNASRSWLDPLDFSEVYAGLETSVKVYLRDEYGQRLASCDEIRAGALLISSSGLEGIMSVRSDTESMVSVCFVSFAPGPAETVQDLEDVVIKDASSSSPATSAAQLATSQRPAPSVSAARAQGDRRAGVEHRS